MPLICTYKVTKRIDLELYWDQGRGYEWTSDFLPALPAIASEGWGFSRSKSLICEVKACGDKEWPVGQRSGWLKDVYLLSIRRKLKLMVWIFGFQKNVFLLGHQVKWLAVLSAQTFWVKPASRCVPFRCPELAFGSLIWGDRTITMEWQTLTSFLHLEMSSSVADCEQFTHGHQKFEENIYTM